MKSPVLIILIMAVLAITGCEDNSATDDGSLRFVISNSEIFEYRTGITGDEDGATIYQQAEHFAISEIRRNADTGYEAVYFYQSEADFVGNDYVELELSTGSDGASPPTDVETVAIELIID